MKNSNRLIGILVTSTLSLSLVGCGGKAREAVAVHSPVVSSTPARTFAPRNYVLSNSFVLLWREHSHLRTQFERIRALNADMAAVSQAGPELINAKFTIAVASAKKRELLAKQAEVNGQKSEVLKKKEAALAQKSELEQKKAELTGQNEVLNARLVEVKAAYEAETDPEKKEQLARQIEKMTAQISQIQGGLEQVAGGLKQVEAGLAQIEAGLTQLDAGLAQIAGGLAQIDEKIQEASRVIGTHRGGLPASVDGFAEPKVVQFTFDSAGKPQVTLTAKLDGNDEREYSSAAGDIVDVAYVAKGGVFSFKLLASANVTYAFEASRAKYELEETQGIIAFHVDIKRTETGRPTRNGTGKFLGPK